jgi:hypothetical protein
MTPVPAVTNEEIAQYQPHFDAILRTDPYTDRVKLLAYGVQYTGKTTQALSVYLNYLTSRISRGLPTKKLLRITGEPSGETAIQTLVEAGLCTNISLAAVSRPRAGITCQGILQALISGKLVVPCAVSTRYKQGIMSVPFTFNDYGMLLFEGIDSTANMLTEHMHAAGINVTPADSKDGPPPTWASNAPPSETEDAMSFNSGAMNKDLYAAAQNTIVNLVANMSEMPFDVIYMTSHERTAEEKSSVGGKNAEVLGRLNGPAVVGPAGVKKLLTQVDLLFHTETANDGQRYVFFNSHPDLTAPTVSWTACSRLEPLELAQLESLCQFEARLNGTQHRKGSLLVVPGQPEDPRTRDINWLLRASRFLRNCSRQRQATYLANLQAQATAASESPRTPA